MKGALWAVDRPSPPGSLLWRISRSHNVPPEPAVGAKGHSPPVPGRTPRVLSAAGPGGGGGHTSRPEQSAGSGPLPFPPRRLRPLTARSSPGSAPALRPPPPYWRCRGGSAAPGRPHCSRTGRSGPSPPQRLLKATAQPARAPSAWRAAHSLYCNSAC